MVGDLLKTYPTTGAINVEVDQQHRFYHEVLNDLKKLGQYCATNTISDFHSYEMTMVMDFERVFSIV